MQKTAFQSMVGCSCQDLWHFCSFTDGEATGPAVVGKGELGTSPPGCGGDSGGITCPPCPAASAGAQLSLPGISLVSASALAWAFCCSLAKRFLNRGLETNR